MNIFYLPHIVKKYFGLFENIKYILCWKYTYNHVDNSKICKKFTIFSKNLDFIYQMEAFESK